MNIYLLSISVVNNRYLVSPFVAHEHYTLYEMFRLLLVWSYLSYSFWYLVSPSVAHEHYASCMTCFSFYWHFHVFFLLYVIGIIICCTRPRHIVYDRFLVLLVLWCRLSPLGIWYHHLLHTNMTHCVWYVSFTTGIVLSSLSVWYLVSPYVAHEHYTVCMIGFVYYWYCHVVSLL